MYVFTEWNAILYIPILTHVLCLIIHIYVLGRVYIYIMYVMHADAQLGICNAYVYIFISVLLKEAKTKAIVFNSAHTHIYKHSGIASQESQSRKNESKQQHPFEARAWPKEVLLLRIYCFLNAFKDCGSGEANP